MVFPRGEGLPVAYTYVRLTSIRSVVGSNPQDGNFFFFTHQNVCRVALCTVFHWLCIEVVVVDVFFFHLANCLKSLHNPLILLSFAVVSPWLIRRSV